MKLTPDSIISQIKSSSISNERRVEFGWSGKIATPHNTKGSLIIQTSDPSHGIALDSPFDPELGKAARRFIPAFHAYGLAKGLHHHQDKIAKLIQGEGVEEQDAVILTRLAWVVMLNGLDGLCRNLDRWFCLHGDAAGIPMAPLHLWALGEISACYLTHLDPSASSQEVAADAKLLDAYFGDYCVDFNVRFSPYTSLAVLPIENEGVFGLKNQNAD
jgi:hypothetical protein